MQDRYAGDVGDFGKFALLRALTPGRTLGVCWYRTDGLGEVNNHGRHLAYLDRPERFRHLDPGAFDILRSFIGEVRANRCQRKLEMLEALQLVPRASYFHGVLCPKNSAARLDWACDMWKCMEPADLVFLDPDNGLEGKNLNPKSAALDELIKLKRSGRALLLYHHQSRFVGGAQAEAADIARRLKEAKFEAVKGIRLRPYSSRFYFLIDADEELENRFEHFFRSWEKEAQFFRLV